LLRAGDPNTENDYREQRDRAAPVDWLYQLLQVTALSTVTIEP
jgi:hypothetical protein